LEKEKEKKESNTQSLKGVKPCRVQNLTHALILQSGRLRRFLPLKRGISRYEID
jgi:hypothetical protein